MKADLSPVAFETVASIARSALRARNEARRARARRAMALAAAFEREARAYERAVIRWLPREAA